MEIGAGFRIISKINIVKIININIIEVFTFMG